MVRRPFGHVFFEQFSRTDKPFPYCACMKFAIAQQQFFPSLGMAGGPLYLFVAVMRSQLQSARPIVGTTFFAVCIAFP
jgi:hypothetical protein